MLPENYISLGEGTKIIDALFLSCEGTKQGTVDGPPVFAIALNEINNVSHHTLTAHGGALFSIIDDTTIICTLDVALAVFQSHEQQLHTIGLSINRDKCKIYLPPHLRTQENLLKCTDLGIRIGTLPASDGTSTYGVKIGGIPYGDPSYISRFLDVKASKAVNTFDAITSTLTNSNPPNPSLPCKQAIWVLATRSL